MPSRAPSRITQILFWFDGVIVHKNQDPAQPVTPIDGMLPFIESDLAGACNLAVVLTSPPPTFANPEDAGRFNRLFSAEQVITLPRSSGYPAQVEGMIRHPLVHPGEALLADANPRRTLDSIRAGLDATIYVDLRRFRRDLYIWRIINSDG